MKYEHWRKQALDVSFLSNPIFNIEIHFLTHFSFWNIVSLTPWGCLYHILIIVEKVVSIWQGIRNGSFQHQFPSSPLPTTIICLFFFFFPLISLFRMTHLSIKQQQIPPSENLASFTSRNQACRMQSNNRSC